MKKELCIKQIYDDFISKVILTEQEKEVLLLYIKDYSSEQINGLFEKSKQFGISDETISQIKDSMK